MLVGSPQSLQKLEVKQLHNKHKELNRSCGDRCIFGRETKRGTYKQTHRGVYGRSKTIFLFNICDQEDYVVSYDKLNLSG